MNNLHKFGLLLLLYAGLTVRVNAQENTPTDTSKHPNGATVSKKKYNEGHAIYGITFSRIDLGFTKIMDNGSFTLSDKNSFLKNRAWKTYNFGFDLLQVGYHFSDHFRIFLSGGFDWTYIRLLGDVAFLRNTTTLQYVHTGIDYDKNRLTSSYIRLPLTFEHRFDDGHMRVAYGPIGGFLMQGSQILKNDEQGKLSVRDDFNFTQFKYGAFVRWGYRGLGVYAKYYFNNMFENSPEQDGVKDFTFGIMLGF
ncbi:hypothetical protein SAMN05216436_11943 [bacterium A37T11]|nr:hypothetical protein SAMN05216436_11943 [bacterium A37T11]